MSNQAQHTPGPWQVNQFDPLQVCDCDGVVRGCAPIAKIVKGKGARANARLIAAAPELLAALENLCSFHQASAVGKRVQDEARTAIAKAKGGAA